MKLNLILENIRNTYSLGLLEEAGNISEKDLLQGKILINESTMNIHKMLVEEGTIEAVKQNLEEAWVGAILQEFDMDDAQDAYNYATTGNAPTGALDTAAGYAARGANAVGNAYDSASNAVGNAYDSASNAVANSAPVQAYDQAQNRIAIDQGKQMGQDAIDAAKNGLLTPEQAAAGLGVAGAGLAGARYILPGAKAARTVYNANKNMGVPPKASMRQAQNGFKHSVNGAIQNDIAAAKAAPGQVYNAAKAAPGQVYNAAKAAPGQVYNKLAGMVHRPKK